MPLNAIEHILYSHSNNGVKGVVYMASGLIEERFKPIGFIVSIRDSVKRVEVLHYHVGGLIECFMVIERFG